jgi:hypothetical protein
MVLTILAMVACAPVALAWWPLDRLRLRNRVQVHPREVHTRRVTIVQFVPTRERWGRA